MILKRNSAVVIHSIEYHYFNLRRVRLGVVPVPENQWYFKSKQIFKKYVKILKKSKDLLYNKSIFFITSRSNQRPYAEENWSSEKKEHKIRKLKRFFYIFGFFVSQNVM